VTEYLRQPRLLDDATLHASSVVANSAMNRQRQLAGVNSYAKELGFDPLQMLLANAGSSAGRSWLDLCCGTGRALLQASDQLRLAETTRQVTLVGVDLVNAFEPHQPDPRLTFLTAPVESWEPGRTFDLITCVHGLHYLGDKLAVLAHAVRWLAPTGHLVADLDLNSIRLEGGSPVGRRLSTQLRAAGLSYDPRRRRISCSGPHDFVLPYVYLGADDRAGANYTGQPAVNSYYRANG
jgi:SAM-dependent methyltransferase